MEQEPVTVDDLLARYDEAFVAFDLGRIVACFATPCVFVSEGASGGPTVLPCDPDASRSRVGRILDWHRRLGVTRFRSQARWRLQLSERLACRSLHVVAEDGGGALYAFDGVYTFALQGGVWRIAAICHNQIPALLARLAATPRMAPEPELRAQ